MSCHGCSYGVPGALHFPAVLRDVLFILGHRLSPPRGREVGAGARGTEPRVPTISLFLTGESA
jgi:hypothetical protein